MNESTATAQDTTSLAQCSAFLGFAVAADNRHGPLTQPSRPSLQTGGDLSCATLLPQSAPLGNAAADLFTLAGTAAAGMEETEEVYDDMPPSSANKNLLTETLFTALDETERANDNLERLMNEITEAVVSEDDDDDTAQLCRRPAGSALNGVALSLAASLGLVQDDSYSGNGFTASSSSSTNAAHQRLGVEAAGRGGGFTVEGSASGDYTALHPITLPPPPPPPPPPMYGVPGTAVTAHRSPYVRYATAPLSHSTPAAAAASHATRLPPPPSRTPHPKKPPPPPFSEAIASTTTPQSLPHRLPSQEVSPLGARYLNALSLVPTASPETLLVRNDHGVFLLQSLTKPTPPYTPHTAQTGALSPPLSPLARYALPPPAALSGAIESGGNFLGSSLAQANGMKSVMVPHGSSSPAHLATSVTAAASGRDGVGHKPRSDPPQYGEVAGRALSNANSAVATPYISSGLYTHSVTSVRNPAPYGAAPPPYSAT